MLAGEATTVSSSFGGDVTELFTGANTAPTPQVTTRPPAEVQPEQWTAPKADAPGQLSVHRGELESAADVLKKQLPEISNLISALQQLYGSFDCLAAWPAGQTMCQNLVDLADAFNTVAQQTVQGHEDTAAKLTATAASYEETERSITQTVKGVHTTKLTSGNLSTLLNGGMSSSSGKSSLTTLLEGGQSSAAPGAGKAASGTPSAPSSPSSSGWSKS